MAAPHHCDFKPHQSTPEHTKAYQTTPKSGTADTHHAHNFNVVAIVLYTSQIDVEHTRSPKRHMKSSAVPHRLTPSCVSAAKAQLDYIHTYKHAYKHTHTKITSCFDISRNLIGSNENEVDNRNTTGKQITKRLAIAMTNQIDPNTYRRCRISSEKSRARVDYHRTSVAHSTISYMQMIDPRRKPRFIQILAITTFTWLCSVVDNSVEPHDFAVQITGKYCLSVKSFNDIDTATRLLVSRD